MTRALPLILLVLAASGAFAAPVTEIHYVMGTYFRITAEHPDGISTRAAVHRCFAAARHYDALFSRFDASSELSRLNASSAAPGSVTVSQDFAALLKRALALRQATGGAFDPGVGALTRLWRETSEWPARTTLEAVRRTGGRGSLQVVDRTLTRHADVLIDLDGIAKGWAVDRCVSELRSAGVERALLSFGESSLYAIGAPLGTKGWDVMLRDLSTHRALGTLRLRDQAASVSAVFGHERRIGGRRVGHIIDPRNGLPLQSLAMAVVVADSATDAEAFSKALLIRVDRPRRDSRWVTGALLITADGVRRTGRIAFTRFESTPPIDAAAEPLR